jgi:hypothetical protein
VFVWLCTLISRYCLGVLIVKLRRLRSASVLVSMTGDVRTLYENEVLCAEELSYTFVISSFLHDSANFDSVPSNRSIIQVLHNLLSDPSDDQLSSRTTSYRRGDR